MKCTNNYFKITFLVFVFFSLNIALQAQNKDPESASADEEVFIHYHVNGTSEVLYFEKSVLDSKVVHYMSSQNKIKTKLIIDKYVPVNKTYTLRFPNHPPGEVYTLSVAANNQSLTWKNPDGSLQNFVLLANKQLEYTCRNADGTREQFYVTTNTTQDQIQSVAFTSTASKNRANLTIVNRDVKTQKYTVRYPGATPTYVLEWQVDKAKGLNQILLHHSSGYVQVFLNK